MDWFSGLVYAAVVYILAMSIAKAMNGAAFDPLSVAGSVFLLLALPVAYKLARRRPGKR